MFALSSVPREAGDGFGIPSGSGLSSPIPPELSSTGLAALGMRHFPRLIPKNSHLWQQIPDFALPPVLPSLSFPRQGVSSSFSPDPRRQEQNSMQTPMFSSQISQEFLGQQDNPDRRRGSKSLGTMSSMRIPWDAVPKTSLFVTSIRHL